MISALQSSDQGLIPVAKIVMPSWLPPERSLPRSRYSMGDAVPVLYPHVKLEVAIMLTLHHPGCTRRPGKQY